MENSGKYERPECRKGLPKLESTLLRDSRGWNGSLLPRGYGRETLTLTLERQQFKEILSLILSIVINVT